MIRLNRIGLPHAIAAACLGLAAAAGAWEAWRTAGTTGGLALTRLRDAWLASRLSDPAGQPASGVPAWILDLPAVFVPAVAAVLICMLARAWPRQRRSTQTSARGPSAVCDRAPAAAPGSELAAALVSCRGALVGTALFSAVSNVLVLTGAIFMLQIYDRVLPSRSVPTLVVLGILALMLFAVQGGLDFIRSRLLVRVGTALDEALGARVYDLIVRLPVRAGDRADSLQPMRDLDSVRTFLSGIGPTALFDLPWMPFYLAIVFAFHVSLGVLASLGALVLIGLTLLTELASRGPAREATESGAQRLRLADASRRNAEVLVAMGIAPRLAARWREASRGFLAAQQDGSDVGGGLAALSRVLRLALQSGVLGLGAYLVIHEAASPGIIIASSVITARALAPVDLAISQWRSFVTARQAWRRLGWMLKALPVMPVPMPLPAPQSTLAVENVSISPPGETRVVVADVSFALASGQGLGIAGPSGSGKSSLARAIVGAWLPVRGRVRLDGAALDQWTSEALGRHVGYLPQDVELFAGTIAQNIARFEPDADTEQVVAAAQAANVHSLIVRLPNGYETPIGEHGAALSAGQRQRIGLARALYGNPFIVVLDEPDASLDAEGVNALSRAILGVRERGGIAIVVTHRANVLASVDLLLAMDRGRALSFGAKEGVLKGLRMTAPGQEPLKVLPGGGKTSP